MTLPVFRHFSSVKNGIVNSGELYIEEISKINLFNIAYNLKQDQRSIAGPLKFDNNYINL